MHTQMILEKPSMCLYRAPSPTPMQHPPRSPGASRYRRRRLFHRMARASLEPAATAATSYSVGAAYTMWPWSRQPFLRARARRPQPRPPNPPPRALGRPLRPPTTKLDATSATSDAPGPPLAPPRSRQPPPRSWPASYHRAPRAAPEPAATSATSHSAGAASTPQPMLLCRERVRVGCGDFWGESEGMRGNKTKLEFFREGFTK
jgi:hypothetical protein